MRSNLSRSLAVAAAGGLVPAAFVDLSPGWAPTDYALLGLTGRGPVGSVWASLAAPLFLAAVAALLAPLLRSRRTARFGVYVAAGVLVHWYVLAPLHHGGFPTSAGPGVWLTIASASALGLASILPSPATTMGPVAAAELDEARLRGSLAYMLSQTRPRR